MSSFVQEQQYRTALDVYKQACDAEVQADVNYQKAHKLRQSAGETLKSAREALTTHVLGEPDPTVH